jgi:hypothetical protein
MMNYYYFLPVGRYYSFLKTNLSCEKMILNSYCPKMSYDCWLKPDVYMFFYFRMY